VSSARSVTIPHSLLDKWRPPSSSCPCALHQGSSCKWSEWTTRQCQTRCTWLEQGRASVAPSRPSNTVSHHSSITATPTQHIRTEQVSSHRSCYLCQPRQRLGSGQGHRQRRQQSGQMDQGGDTYQEGARQVDEQRWGVLPTLPHLRHPVRPETEWRMAIRQTIPTKAPVEAETSTLINKRLFT